MTWSDTHAWHDGRMVTFDTETTGLGPRPEAPDAPPKRIVTACMILPRTGPRMWLLNPDCDFEPQAVETHGITPDHAAEHGMDYRAGVQSIADAIDEATHGAALVAYNIAFDLSLLVSECERLEIGFTAPEWLIDPLVIDQALVRRKGTGAYKLENVVRAYGIELTAAHTADADARAAGNLAWRMAQMAACQDRHLAALHGMTFEQLMAWQEAANRRKKDSLRAFWQGKQDPRWESVDSGWPLLENPPFVKAVA